MLNKVKFTIPKDREKWEKVLRLGPLCATSGNTGPSTRQTPGAGPSTRRSTDYAPPLWCGHGRHYSVDWTTGLDYWTGLLDSRKLPLEEKGTRLY